MDCKFISFDLFRFQLLPITQNVQTDAFNKINTLEDLKENKNKIFKEVISSVEFFNHKGYDVHHKVLIDSEDWYVFKIGSKKTVERESPEFIIEKIESWPSVIVIINNNPDIQTIAISSNTKAFSSPRVVSNIIENTIQKNIKNKQISLHINAITDRNDFWNFVKKYEGKITMVRFELISPNMSNISKSLKVDLKQINKDTNSHVMNLELNSVPDSSLEIKTDNEMIDGIVDYSAEGGGDITLKIKGLKKTIHTQKTTRTIELEELETENLSIDILNTLLSALKP